MFFSLLKIIFESYWTAIAFENLVIGGDLNFFFFLLILTWAQLPCIAIIKILMTSECFDDFKSLLS